MPPPAPPYCEPLRLRHGEALSAGQPYAILYSGHLCLRGDEPLAQGPPSGQRYWRVVPARPGGAAAAAELAAPEGAHWRIEDPQPQQQQEGGEEGADPPRPAARRGAAAAPPPRPSTPTPHPTPTTWADVAAECCAEAPPPPPPATALCVGPLVPPFPLFFQTVAGPVSLSGRRLVRLCPDTLRELDGAAADVPGMPPDIDAGTFIVEPQCCWAMRDGEVLCVDMALGECRRARAPGGAAALDGARPLRGDRAGMLLLCLRDGSLLRCVSDGGDGLLMRSTPPRTVPWAETVRSYALVGGYLWLADESLSREWEPGAEWERGDIARIRVTTGRRDEVAAAGQWPPRRAARDYRIVATERHLVVAVDGVDAADGLWAFDTVRMRWDAVRGAPPIVAAFAGLVATADTVFLHAPTAPDWSAQPRMSLGPQPPESKWHAVRLGAGEGWACGALRDRCWGWAPAIARLFPAASRRMARAWLLCQRRRARRGRGRAGALPAPLLLLVLHLADHRVALESTPARLAPGGVRAGGYAVAGNR